MKVALGCDHGGYFIKKDIISHLESKGFEILDCGSHSAERCDYPDTAKIVCEKVLSGDCDCGVLICGTGIGMSIAANKIKGIRAAVVNDPYCARLCKQHNNANIITFGARVVGLDIAKMILDEYFNAEFLGDRHKTRIDMIMDLEKN